MAILLRILLLTSLLTSSIAHSMQKTDAVVAGNPKAKPLITVNWDSPIYHTGVGIGKSALTLGLSYFAFLSTNEALRWMRINQRVPQASQLRRAFVLNFYTSHYHYFLAAGSALSYAAYSAGRQVPEHFAKASGVLPKRCTS